MDRLYVVYCPDPSTITLEEGMVHIADTSGDLTFRRVMSVHTFRRLARQAARVVAELDAQQGAVVVPMRKKPRGNKDA